MQKMLILSGLPASGKTSFANNLVSADDNYYRISWDDLRHVDPNYKFSKENEKRIQNQSYDIARKEAALERNLIIDNTNLTAASIGKWAKLASELHMLVQVEKFDIPVEECIKRDALRDGWRQVGRVVIERMALANGLIQFPVTNDQYKNIVIVDVDGTLADTSHRLVDKNKLCKNCKGTGKVTDFDTDTGRFFNGFCCQMCGGKGTVTGVDWNVFFRPDVIAADPVFPVVAEWVRELYKYYIVIIVSGRAADRSGKETVKWLDLNNIPYHHIFMRNGGDMRDDVIVKQEILDKLPKNRVLFCIDDRTRVCQMWRKNGLKVYQVVSPEEGDF